MGCTEKFSNSSSQRVKFAACPEFLQHGLFSKLVSALHLRLRFEVNYSFTMTKTTALHIPLISMHVAKITE